jgi:hypothetical protein
LLQVTALAGGAGGAVWQALSNEAIPNTPRRMRDFEEVDAVFMTKTTSTSFASSTIDQDA